jgi:lysylphosphatidylglycerol synthetase-like protein (DUF2156 family)
MAEPNDDVVIEHPNRGKVGSKATKAVIVLLLLVSAALVTIVTVGGWDALQGAKSLQIAFIVIYLVIAFYIARWRSGLLPVAAALAIVLLIFAAVAGPEWFARDKEGFQSPALDEDLLGLLTLIVIPVQVLVIIFSMQGFSQQWSIEVERHPDGTTRSAAA